MTKKLAAIVLIFSIVMFWIGCGGGGGGTAVTTPTTTTTPTNELSQAPSKSNNSTLADGQSEVVTDFSVNSIPAPTTAELTALQNVDSGMFAATTRSVKALSVSQCTVISKGTNYYSGFLDAAVADYNAIKGNKRFPTTINFLTAEHRGNKSEAQDSTFNVFECASGEFNAQTGYRNIIVYDELLTTLEEATLLLFFVDTQQKYTFYLNKVTEYMLQGKHWQVVTPALRDLVVKDATANKIASLIFGQAVEFVVFHEIGHAALSHSLQKLRASPSKDVWGILTTLLSWAAEFQADIFSANTVQLAGGDPKMGNLFFAIAEFLTSGTLSSTHPAPKYRRYVIHQVAAGTTYANLLTPLWTSAKQAMKDVNVTQKGNFSKPRLGYNQ